MFAAKDALLTRPSGGYVIPRSLRFRSSASAYLNRTFAAGNQKTFTWSAWVKRGTLGVYGGIFGPSRASPDQIDLRWQSDNTLLFYVQVSAASQCYLQTVRVFRDPSAWYHLVLKVDTTQATAANRTIWYVNGVAETAYTGVTYPGLNADISGWNTTGVNYISNGNSGVTDQTLADVYFIDGQALSPTSFGATNATTGVWAPIKYTGTYGANGFHLDFNSYATTAALGTDTSGNGNTWTVNNISVTAGVTYDSMIDVPTVSSTGSNYCTLNPLRPSSNTASGGNLNIVIAASETGLTGTMQFPPSKSYFEEQFSTTTAAAVGAYLGVCNADVVLNGAANYGLAGVWSVICTAAKNRYNNGSLSGSAAGATANTVTLQIAVDNVTSATDTYVWFGADNVFYDSSMGTTGNPSTGANPTFTITNKVLFPHFSGYQNTISANFGQRAFAYTPPSGYSALNTYNLPTPTILKGNTVMDATLYTGTGASLSVTNAAGFQPDFVWVKGRSGATDHALYDSVRGVQKQIESNTTTAETTETTGLTAFDSGGFTVGALAQMNTSAATYVGWQWKGGGAAVSNTSGSRTTSVSASTISGCSIVTGSVRGAGVQDTFGHGLGITPQMILVKDTSGVYNWAIFHVSVSTNTSRYLVFTTAAVGTYSTVWGAALPTSSVFGLTGDGAVGANNNFVAYCFAPIAGYSAFGSYTGNGSTDGPFVFLGFRPRYLLLKVTSTTGDWVVYDSARDTYNPEILYLYPNTTAAEGGSVPRVDFLSNGFKLRQGGQDNGSAATYVYAAFAEFPFKNSLAR